MQPLMPLLSLEFGSEIIYSFVIILCSLMIHYATKEMDELSSYKGIHYFRKAFLFFALAYFFRSFIKFLLVYFNPREVLEFLPRSFGATTTAIFLYCSAMAVFYLLYSVMWKKWNHSKQRIILFNILALSIAVIGTLFNTIEVSLIINLILLAFIFVVIYKAYKDSSNKKGKGLFIIYLLLFVFYILNVIDILIPSFLQSSKLLIYLISIALFMAILYKVLKRTGA